MHSGTKCASRKEACPPSHFQTLRAWNRPALGKEQHLIFATVLEELSQATEVETPETRRSADPEGL